MSWMCEESRLLVTNWDTVEAIFEAEQRLRSELTTLLHSVEPELAKYDWWQNGWAFVRYQDAQIYISNKRWQTGGSFVLWIGVEGFTPGRIFGSESPPSLYVWLSSNRSDLSQALVKALDNDDGEVFGELCSGASRYVVRQAVTKCLPEEADWFAERAREQIVDFFAHYAQALWRLDEAIQGFLS